MNGAVATILFQQCKQYLPYMKHASLARLREIEQCIAISCKNLLLSSINMCIISDSKMVASRHVAGTMILMVKTSDIKTFSSYVHDCAAVKKGKGPLSFVYNRGNQVSFILNGDLIQATQEIMRLAVARDDTCAPDVQVLLERRDTLNCVMIVRGCTEDLLKLEMATKLILHYANKAVSFEYDLAADLCLFYSPLAWKAGGRTNLDKLFLEEACASPIIEAATLDLMSIEGFRSLNELLKDATGKHYMDLLSFLLVT